MSNTAQRAQARFGTRFWARATFVGVAVAAVLLLPLFTSTYMQSVWSLVWIYALFAISLDVLWGQTGLFSLGHAAFFGAGGYACAVLSVKYDVDNLWLLALSGIGFATVLGIVFGVVALRVHGAYFLLVTLALGQLTVALATDWSYLSIGTGDEGLFGIIKPRIPPVDAFRWSNRGFYWLCALSFLIGLFIVRLVLRSSLGARWRGVRENPERMRSLGFNTWAYRYSAFVFAAMIAGTAGVLLSWHRGFVVPEDMGIGASTLGLIMVLIGGPGTLYGPALGAVGLVLTDHYLTSYQPERWPIIMGAIYVAIVIFARGGVWPNAARGTRWIKRRSRLIAGRGEARALAGTSPERVP